MALKMKRVVLAVPVRNVKMGHVEVAGHVCHMSLLLLRYQGISLQRLLLCVTTAGPNDTSGVVWAISMFFPFPFAFYSKTDYFI